MLRVLICISFYLALVIGFPAFSAPNPAVLSAYAPVFPSCLNPGGELKASYNSGTHGIPGDPAEHRGRDSVYQIASGKLIQCFCPESGSAGIQTNWWQATSLTGSEIESYKTQGWIFVPDGAKWGLNSSSYLAKNTGFNCYRIGGIVLGEMSGLPATGLKSFPLGFYAIFLLVFNLIITAERTARPVS